MWATVVMLGGFCTLLEPTDFWSTTAIIFIEAFRFFTRDNRLENHPLFGTNAAIKKLTSHSVLKDEKHTFYAVLAVVSLCDRILFVCPRNVKGIALIVMAASGVLIGNLPFAVQTILQHHLWLFLSSLLVILLTLSAQLIRKFWIRGKSQGSQLAVVLVHTAVLLLMVIVQSISVYILVCKPPRVRQIISKWIKVLYLVKVVLGLALIVGMFSLFLPSVDWFVYGNLVKMMVTLIFALSTIPSPNNETAYYWMDVGLCISMAISWVFCIESAVFNPGVLLVILICGNLQLPAAIARMLLSAMRLQDQQLVKSYPTPGSKNLLPTLHLFYWFVIFQGTFYLCACIINFYGAKLQLHNEKGLGDVQKEEAAFGPQTILDTYGTRLQLHNEKGLGDVQTEEEAFVSQTIPDGSIAISIRSDEEQSNTNPVNCILVGTLPVPL
ncbi:hypothetical protein CFC21_053294 [Triticum aestivum]|uniref:Uncharacterized protein n=4 Tax=Triticum TaxID=4564 RepID=A0A9R0W2T4_TRITD|nr:uncharacterized protein LOC123086981 isoform X1 [Triticum aestivum]XP_044364785.1 uncharacterized protein LOC123086981 isoform X1 [Triticum aestivum]KAF7044008.1 hypothetical protein CFC21_053294 [Triticum aestivum]VAH94678.1 unnamed protein product [Triticum turgidum subsp. durum]